MKHHQINIEFQESAGRLLFRNQLVEIMFDTVRGTYSAIDKMKGTFCLDQAYLTMNHYKMRDEKRTSSWQVQDVFDDMGMGKCLTIRSRTKGEPDLLLSITLYQDKGFIALAAGLHNTTKHAVQLHTFDLLSDAVMFRDSVSGRLFTLDGNGGGKETRVSESHERDSLNNLLVFFGEPGNQRSLVLGGLTYQEFEKAAKVKVVDQNIIASLYAQDPVGKRIEPDTSYRPDDRFYIDFMTTSPFDAMEEYGENLATAQRIVLPVYSFVAADMWFAQVDRYGGGFEEGYRGYNDSIGAVEEMACIQKSGFTRYAPVAVYLEPDLYDEHNQQGWWDDEHWRRGPDSRATGVWKNNWNGQYVPPYDTTRKWAGAVQALGGMPFLYVQTGFRSQDYAETYPGHMLFNQPDVLFLDKQGNPVKYGEDAYPEWKKGTYRKLGYDYTDPDFIRHVREVWRNLREAGIKGVKFDYPDFPFTGWPTAGGMENRYATTAMHYRNIFRLAKEGLGPDCYLDERTLNRGSDVTLGLVTSQRTEGDTDEINPGMVSRVGLRWYKNRKVVHYDMDGKNPFKAKPFNRDGERKMWTMSYVASGRLMVVPSFGRMTPQQLHDLSRIFPFHTPRQSARPIDAFLRPYPQIYDFRVKDTWHQVTYYNTDDENCQIIEAPFSGDNVLGALGLKADCAYYVYDFWNDQFLGKWEGSGTLRQELRPGEARMMAVRQVEQVPQLLATDRHIMQGYVDVLGCEWDPSLKQLRGVSSVVSGEPYKIIIACNGYIPVACELDRSIEERLPDFNGASPAASPMIRIEKKPNGIIELQLEGTHTGPAAWRVMFASQETVR